MNRLYTITEPMVRNRHWANLYNTGIRHEAATRKEELTDLTDGSALPHGGGVVIVNAVSRRWTSHFLEEARQVGLRPLVLAPIERGLGVSSICLDFLGTYSGLCQRLGVQPGRLAFVGAVMTSFNDEEKLHAFFGWGGRGSHVFINQGHLADTFARFAASLDTYDGVLCTNDVVMLALMRFLGQRGERLRFAAVSNTVVAAESARDDRVILADFDCMTIGRQAVRLAGYMARSFSLREIHERIKSNIQQNELPPCQTAAPVNFYSDRILDDIFRFECMLASCDALDRRILEGLQARTPYFRIAAELHVSESTVKYRLRRMRDLSGFDSFRDWKDWVMNERFGMG